MISKEGLTHHISAQFNAELEEVRSHLLAMGGLVEKQVNDAVTALIEADSGLAQQVREIDDQINQMERLVADIKKAVLDGVLKMLGRIQGQVFALYPEEEEAEHEVPGTH